MKTSISLADVESVKHELIQILPDVKSSHRVEAMARGLGWNSNAHLRAELVSGPQLRATDNRTFCEYLEQHGFPGARFDALDEAVVRTKHADIRSAIEAVMAAQPLLSANGYRTEDRRKSPLERDEDFQRLRAEMLTAHAVAEFLRAREYLEQVPRRATVNRNATSYGWKHQAEQFHTANHGTGSDYYVSNGIFIAAAMHLGFTVKRIEATPNAYLNIGTATKPSNSPGKSRLAAGVSGPTKIAAWRNMMVAAVNAGLDQGLFGLEADDNRWGDGTGVFRFDFAGLPAIASVHDAGFGELSIHMAVNPTEHAAKYIKSGNAGLLAGDAFAAGWLERKEGRWIQTSAKPMAAFRRTLLPVIAGTAVVPKGFAAGGPFKL